MHRHRDRLVIEPLRTRGLVALLETMRPLEASFPEIDDPAPALRIAMTIGFPKQAKSLRRRRRATRSAPRVPRSAP
jgi:hypothetical protein